MKKSAGRKALRMRMRQNRREEGRKRAKENEWRQKRSNQIARKAKREEESAE